MERPEVPEGEHGRDAAELVGVQGREERIGHEEQHGVRVVHDVVDVVGTEVGKDRDDHGPVRHGGEPDDRPSRRVPSQESDLVAGRDVADPEDLVQMRDFVRDLAVRQPPAFPVRQGGTRPVAPHALPDETDEVFLPPGGGGACRVHEKSPRHYWFPGHGRA